jgi:hypothetical protein
MKTQNCLRDPPVLKALQPDAASSIMMAGTCIQAQNPRAPPWVCPGPALEVRSVQPERSIEHLEA